MQTIDIHTSKHTEFVDITAQVNAALVNLGVQSGGVTIFVPHTTAGIMINENSDPDVMADLAAALNQIVPWRNNYRHTEGNSAAHLKASLLGTSVRVLVEGGCLRLGTWQAIYFCEFDGPRCRQVWVGW